MDIKQYLRVLRDHWLLVASCLILGTLAAGLVAFTQTPVYAASGQLFVSTVEGGDVSQLAQGGQFSQQRVKSYADIVSSPQVAKAVISQLGLTDRPEDLQKQISATAPLDTVLINYTVSDESPRRARAIAMSVGVQFADFVQKLETPQGKSVSPVKVSVTRQPELPRFPVSPRKKLDLALGLLLGLAVGVGAAVLRESMDNTVGSKHDPTMLTQSPVLAVIPEDPAAKKTPLILDADKFSLRGEAYRQLRTNIRFLGIDRSVRSFVVTSSVASEGKTSTATNLAIALATAGDRVALVDADLRRPQVADTLGIPTGAGLTDVLVGDMPLSQALQTWREDLPLLVLTSGPIPPNPSELLSSHRMDEVVAQLADVASVIIFDTPPLLPVTDAAILSRITGGAMLVTRTGVTKAHQLQGAVQTLHTAGATVLGVVLSRVPKRGKGASYQQYYYEGAAKEPSGGTWLSRGRHTAPPAPVPPQVTPRH